ncbi:MAG TPA: hypothetical protein VGR07_13315 [Thermoanaerobaculia bacterium]|nr:hypothetical protein [Thermoanaerobaculia bacterium]
MSSVAAPALALPAQAPSGAFLATVHHHGEVFPGDENGFVTALLVAELERLPYEEVGPAIERALDFLERCRGTSGAFHFYPPGAEPAWMGARLAADADDTALFARVLRAHGRLTREETHRLIDSGLEPFRVHYRPESEPVWVRPGCYRTWLDRRARPNPVDCCVNANVAAFLKAAGRADHPGYAAACRTVAAGVRWAGGVDWQARSLVPWYPHPGELVHALDRAVAAGVSELAEALAFASAQAWARSDRDAAPERPLCGSLRGKTYWTCTALENCRSTRNPLPTGMQ